MKTQYYNMLKRRGFTLLMASLLLAITSACGLSATPTAMPTAIPTATFGPPGVWIKRGPKDEFISTVAIDPANPNIIYAGTDHGMLVSSDAGGSWPEVYLSFASVGHIFIAPSKPPTVYVGTDQGFYVTTDGGKTWGGDLDEVTSYAIHAIAIDPTTPNTIYTSASTSSTNYDKKPEGVFKSTDGGNSWNLVNTGLPSLADSQVVALAIDPATPTTLYAGTDLGSGVFKSTDGGKNWSAVNTGLLLDKYNKFPHIYTLAIASTTPATIYLGTLGGMFKSTDGGGTWSAANTGLTNTGISAIAIDPKMPTTLYLGTDDGVFKSTNSGENWSAVDNAGLTNTGITTLAIDPATPTTLYVGTRDGGVFVIQQAK